MWNCPKCNKSFKRQNQNHFCLEKPQTIDEYISMQEESKQVYLNEVRDTIKTAIPYAKEKISWSMPTYYDKSNIIHFASFKNHIGIYPGPEAIEYFKKELKGYKTSKGAIQFLYTQTLPLDLIEKIAKWCYKINTKK